MAITLDGFDGTLPSTLGVLYTATAPSVVVGFTCTNAHTGNVIGSAYLRRSGSATPRPILLEHDFPRGETFAFPISGPTRHVLKTGDTIEGVAATAGVIHYIVSVIQRT